MRRLPERTCAILMSDLRGAGQKSSVLCRFWRIATRSQSLNVRNTLFPRALVGRVILKGKFASQSNRESRESRARRYSIPRLSELAAPSPTRDLPGCPDAADAGPNPA